MLFYDPFMRKYSVRKIGQLMAPPLASTQALDLPQMSIYHYMPNGALDHAPANDEYLFRNIHRPIMMEHITQLGDGKGAPRRLGVNPAGLIRQYHTRHRRFVQLKELSRFDTAGMTLVVENYGFMTQLYKYQRNAYAGYNQWYNVQAALWKRVGELAESTVRHQFVKIQLPTTLPSMSDLNKASMGMSVQSVRVLHDPENFFILEMWKWLGDHRKDSLIGRVPEEKLHQVNLIFQESGRWTVVNLGVLNSWRVAPKDELELNPKANKEGLDAHQMQRRFLKLMMMVFEVRSGKTQSEDIEVKKSTGGPEERSLPGSPIEASSSAEVVMGPDGLPKHDPILNAEVLQPREGHLPEIVDTILVHQDENAPVDTGKDYKHDPIIEAKIEADLAELERISKEVAARREEIEEEFVEDPVEDPAARKPVVGITQTTPIRKIKDLAPIDAPAVETSTIEVNHSAGIKVLCDRLADQGMLSAAQHTHFMALSKKHETIAAPDGKSMLGEFLKVHPDMIVIKEAPSIPDQPTIVDKTMLKSSLIDFDQRYIRDVLHRDVAAMVMSIQNAGICVTDYQMEHVEDITGDYDEYTCRVTPVEGAPSTLRWKLPSIKDDGTYESNNVKYRMRKQRGDLPIRKIAPDAVTLTSYYGKVFVGRSEKKVNDYGTWLRNAIMAIGLDPKNEIVQDLQPADVFDPTFVCPKLYSTLAMGFKAFSVKSLVGNLDLMELNFDHTNRDHIPANVRQAYERDGSVIVGTMADRYIVMDAASNLLAVKGTDVVQLPELEVLLGLDGLKAPVEFAEVKVMAKTIPIGVLLAYEMGLDKLMKLLQVEPRRVQAGKRIGLLPTEYALVFDDETLVFPKANRRASLVLGGFQEYHKSIRGYSVYEFDRRGVYFNVLESQGLSVRMLREIDLMYQLFIEPITRELLVEMKEPTTFQGLLLRAVDLLLSDQHPHELDPSHMRIKGYERMAGAVYRELVMSIRAHNGRAGKARQQIDFNPFQVWINIAEDPSKEQVSDINPIQNLKETEAVTYSGVGGRNSRSMVKHTRAYHENDMGTISESTVDSGDVAINTYTSADPQFTSLRGISKRYKIGETGATALLSTSALVSVGADRDDPKRVNFIGIQHRHGVACQAYTANAVRTGYEQVLAHRTNDLFAFTAKKPGKVLSVNEHGMVVEYDDGEKKGIELGRRFGSAQGLTIPHTVITDMKPNQKFKVGQLLCHNDGFFERDVLNPDQVVWKAGVTVKVVLMESPMTLEDSSAISKRAAMWLQSKMTKVRNVVVDFKQNVRHLVKVGQELTSESILCIIEDAVTANAKLYDEESLDTLRLLTNQSPVAKAKGTVERIEVYYHGDKVDMSPSLKALATESDKLFALRHQAVGRKALTGMVGESFRIDGDPLNLDCMAIRIFITSPVPAGVGDKGVFGNQMKTVFGRVMENEMTTESGKVIDAEFGQKSIFDRIVSSPDIIGTSTTLLDVIGMKALEIYEK